MPIIALSNGKETKVDEEAYRWLNQFTWRENTSGYAVVRGHERDTYLHRVIAQTPKHLYTDHINGDVLDNRNCNLRNVTLSQNAMNRDSVTKGRSKYKGVSWCNRSNKWRVEIQKEGKRKHLGYFSDELDAAKAYIDTAEKLHREYSNLSKDFKG